MKDYSLKPVQWRKDVSQLIHLKPTIKMYKEICENSKRSSSTTRIFID